MAAVASHPLAGHAARVVEIGAARTLSDSASWYLQLDATVSYVQQRSVRPAARLRGTIVTVGTRSASASGDAEAASVIVRLGRCPRDEADVEDRNPGIRLLAALLRQKRVGAALRQGNCGAERVSERISVPDVTLGRTAPEGEQAARATGRLSCWKRRRSPCRTVQGRHSGEELRLDRPSLDPRSGAEPLDAAASAVSQRAAFAGQRLPHAPSWRWSA